MIVECSVVALVAAAIGAAIELERRWFIEPEAEEVSREADR